MDHAREDLGKDLGGRAAVDHLPDCEVLALGGRNERDLVERDALLFGEAHGSPCRRADMIVGDGPWWAGDLLDDVRLAKAKARNAGGQTPGTGESFDARPRDQTVGAQIFFK